MDNKGPRNGYRPGYKAARIEIKDLIPEGTLVKKGDYIAQPFDKTELSNMLKDAQERLTTMKQQLEVASS